MKYLVVFVLPIAFIMGCTQLAEIDSFEKCADAGNPVAESYPRQCRTPDGRTFTEGMTYEEAEAIAQDSVCTANATLKSSRFYNENSKTWWIELNIEKQGCNPACVIHENKTVEINWRCTGLILP
jgi:hypothetical protein